jgi:hypothetical protein
VPHLLVGAGLTAGSVPDATRGGRRPPRNRRRPRIAGTGHVGAPLVADAGLWDGTPAPALGYRWRRDGMDIPGATGTRYVPGAADATTGISCAIQAANAAGTAEAVSNTMTVTRPERASQGELADQILILDSGVHTLDASSVFPGPSLSFSVTGEGISIDPATGVLSIATDSLREGLAVTVRARNADGSAEQSFTLSIAASAEAMVIQPAPSVIGRLADLIVSAGVQALTVEAAAVFAGTDLVFAVTGAAATVDPATGRVTIPTDTPRAAEPVTVTATNSGGTAAVTFLVTVSAGLADFPPAIPATRWSVAEVRDAAPEGRRRVAIAPDVVVPEGFELRVYSGPVPGGAPTLQDTAAIRSGETLATADGIGVGETCHNLLFWRRVEDDAWTRASQNVVVFEMRGLEAVEPVEPVAVAPAILTAPILAGTGEIGSAITLDSGSWSGQPTPEVGFRWLRDGAEIEGATAAVYVPVAEDDLADLTCVVSARNLAGEAIATTEAIAIRYPAPATVGALADEIFDEGTGPQAVPTAQAFEGANLAFAVTGAGASIDPATGVVTIATDAPFSETVTVSAANSGGSATQAFGVTVEALAGEAAGPVTIAADLWRYEAGEWSAANGGARMSVTVDSAIEVPEGFELRVYVGADPEGAARVDLTRAIAPGVTLTTNGHFSRDVYARLFWHETTTGTFSRADDGAKLIAVNAPVSAAPQPSGDLPPWDEIVGSMTALRAAIAAHGNEARSYRIGLSAGNWGDLDLSEIRTVEGAPIVIGSADYDALGAKTWRVRVDNSDRLHFQFLDIDRQGMSLIGGGGNSAMFEANGAHDCGIEYSRLHGSTQRNDLFQPYANNHGAHFGNTSLRRAANGHVRCCAVGGHLGKGLTSRGGDNIEFIENVFWNMGGDDTFGAGNLRVIDNWSARERFVHQSDPARSNTRDHPDASQLYAGAATNRIADGVIRGNVIMNRIVNPVASLPMQGFVAFDNPLDNFVIEQNFALINSQWGVEYTPKQGSGSNNICRHNAGLRTIDGPGSLNWVTVRVSGLNAASRRNIHASHGTSALPSGSDSVRITITSTEAGRQAQLAYYGGAGNSAALRLASSYYDCRPAVGSEAHWDHSDPVGPALRFKEVIVDGKHPANRPGPAGAIWRMQYDPQRQIMS